MIFKVFSNLSNSMILQTSNSIKESLKLYHRKSVFLYTFQVIRGQARSRKMLWCYQLSAASLSAQLRMKMLFKIVSLKSLLLNY